MGVKNVTDERTNGQGISRSRILIIGNCDQLIYHINLHLPTIIDKDVAVGTE